MNLNHGVLHLWSRFGDPSLKEWWVMARTTSGVIHTHGHTHTQTDAVNNNTWRPKLASGKNPLISCISFYFWAANGPEFGTRRPKNTIISEHWTNKSAYKVSRRWSTKTSNDGQRQLIPFWETQGSIYPKNSTCPTHKIQDTCISKQTL